jgi:hypothetical protein
LSDLRHQLRVMIDSIQDRDVLIDLIIDLVPRSLGRRGGRPPNRPPEEGPENPFTTPSQPVANGNETPSASGGLGASDPGSVDLVLSDPSEKTLGDRRSDGRGAAKAVVRVAKPNLLFQVLEWFCAAWEAQYETEYKTTPKDKSHLGRLLQTLKPDEVAFLPEAFAIYVNAPDKFAAEAHRHSLAHFCADGWLNKVRTRARTEGHTQKGIGAKQAALRYVMGGDK